MRPLVLFLMLCCAPFLQAASATHGSETDPLRSPLWEAMRQRFIGDAPVVFDPRVQVWMPAAAEDPLAVPVQLQIEDLGEIERIVVFADLNPIPKVLEYLPRRAGGTLAFRLKVEQSTPVRAAVLTRAGRWHVGGAWVAAAGGGCTMPSHASADPVWQERLGEVAARQWPREGGQSRLRLRVIHPMDTGLAAGIPVFHIDRLQVRDAAGTELAQLRLYEPVSENPVLSLDLRHQGPLRIDGLDTQGNAISAKVAP